MEQNPKVEPVVEPTVEPEVVEPIVEPMVETEKTPSRTEILRELSKELGVNLFEAEGMQQVKTLVDSQKTEQQKLQEKLDAYEQEKTEWQNAKLEYEAKLKASELGIKKDSLEDALKLAGGDPDKLADVIKKYPVFKSTEGIKIGVQDPNTFQNPTGDTEVEQYLAERAKQNPAYAKYVKK